MSPEFARRHIVFLIEGGWGVILSCEALAKGVDNIQTSSSNGRMSKVKSMTCKARGEEGHVADKKFYKPIKCSFLE